MSTQIERIPKAPLIRERTAILRELGPRLSPDARAALEAEVEEIASWPGDTIERITTTSAFTPPSDHHLVKAVRVEYRPVGAR
jgi:hypothetical protein